MKTFEQYIEGYLAGFNHNITSNNIRYWIYDENLILLSDSYKNKEKLYGYFPFELNLGLFKFICDDIDLDWYKALTNLKLGIPRKTKLHDILPKEFINQIIEL